MFPNILYILLLFPILKAVNLQSINNCPDIFKYNTERSQPGRWFGTIRLTSEVALSGVWLRLKFDKPAIQLGNWFGQIKTDDHILFRLSDRNFELKKNQPIDVPFFVNYDQNGTPPVLVSILLNGRTLCPLEEGTTTTLFPGLGEAITSKPLFALTQSTTYRPYSQETTYRPTTITSKRPTTTESKKESEDDFYKGDLNGFKPNTLTPSSGNTDDICGTVIRRPNPLITNGELTHEGEFPWHAAIYRAKGINLVYICGASLINKEYLLTAAHCLTRPGTEKPSKTSSMVIYLGKHYLKEWSSEGIQDRKVSNMVIHPHFRSDTFKHDIAIIKLSAPISITNYVRPACLWEDSTSLHYLVNQPGTVVGWGYDEDGIITAELHKATMPIVAQDTCIYSYPDFFAKFTSDTTFCAGYRNGTAACNGDSGSGMVFQKTRPQTGSQVWQLRGIVSLGVALQNEARCNTSQFVVFTDVAKHVEWVKSVLNPNRNEASDSS